MPEPVSCDDDDDESWVSSGVEWSGVEWSGVERPSRLGSNTAAGRVHGIILLPFLSPHLIIKVNNGSAQLRPAALTQVLHSRRARLRALGVPQVQEEVVEERFEVSWVGTYPGGVGTD